MALKSQIATNREQAKKLISLGIEIGSADMFWDGMDGDLLSIQVPNGLDNDKGRVDIDFGDMCDVEPRWSLSKLLLITNEKLNKLEKYIKVESLASLWYMEVLDFRQKQVFGKSYENLIDGVVEVLEKIMSGKIK